MDFKTLAFAFSSLEKTTKRLEMTKILAELFAKASADEIAKILYLLQGRVAPPFEEKELGLGERLVEQAISLATGYHASEIRELYTELGDLGLAVEKLVGKKKQQTLFAKKLTVLDVFSAFKKIAEASGPKSQQLKIKLLAELIHNSEPIEARYIVRIPLNKLRLGIGDPTVLDALSVMKKGDKQLRESLERAYNVTSNIGFVAEKFFREGIKGINTIKIEIGRPIRPALAERLPNAEEIIKKIGRCAVEAKYDGFRMQIHKKGKEVKLFSRAATDMTYMFPEIVDAIRLQKCESFIIDSECLGYDPKNRRYHSFQETMQRRRKYGISDKAKEIPLHLFVFDILYLNGDEMINKAYEQRRKALEKNIDENETVHLSDMIIAETPEELLDYFNACVNAGLEGVIAKDLKAPYTVGARKFAWIKLKKSYETALSDTIDAVIVGYDIGKGKRKELGLGTILVAVYDEQEDVFKTLAKVGTGFSEEDIKRFKQKLDEIKIPHKSPRLISKVEADVWVEPKYVVEISGDEITKSSMHTCGISGGETYALRFPRIVRSEFRDKRPEEATTVTEIIKMAKMQKRKSG